MTYLMHSSKISLTNKNTVTQVRFVKSMVGRPTKDLNQKYYKVISVKMKTINDE